MLKWCGVGDRRLGILAFRPDPAWMMDVVALAVNMTYTSVSALIQFTSVGAFKAGIELERYLWCSRRILEGLALRCAHILSQTGVRIHAALGGF